MKQVILKFSCTVIFTFLFFLSFDLLSQTQQPLLNPKAKDTIREVNYKRMFERAEMYMLDDNYTKAQPLYDSLVTLNPKNASWNFKLGLCYLHSATEYSKSIQYLEYATANSMPDTKDNSFKEEKAPLMSYLYLGDAYHRNYRFDEAIEAYRKFLSFISPQNKFYTTYVDHKIQICINAKELMVHPVNMVIKNMGAEINSPYPDYAPVLSADESVLLFTSRRPGSVGGKLDIDGSYFEDIYISNHKEDGTGWTKAKNIGAPINTSGNEATISTSIDGQILFIYKDDDSGSIYITAMQGDNWTVPEKVKGDVNSKYWETHAVLSADGNTLYFVSNRPGGYGGRDIYRCKKLPTGDWSKAMNLGPSINTPYEEDSPFLQPGTNTLYFSSQGHKSMGGFDIFYSDYVDTGATGGWSEPQNIGYPVNTTGDDIFYVPTVDKKRAYFSSAGSDSYGATDIYELTFPENEESKLTVLRGDISDDFGKVPAGALVTVTDEATGEIVGNYAPNPKTGRYLLILPHKKTYKLAYNADGFYQVTTTYKVEPGKEYKATEMVFILPNIRLERKELGTIGVFGIITNLQKKTVKDVTINIIDNSNGKLIGTYTSDNTGKYEFVLKRGLNYNISFESNGYLMQSANVNMPKEKKYSSVEKNIVLQPIEKGSKIVLNNLFFDTNKSRIRKDSYVELENITKFLKKRPDINVEVAGYTDDKGDAKSNLKLSQERAKAVMNYLVKKGIPVSRIVSKGYGEEQSVASNDTEQGRQENRRVELKILGE